MSFGGGGGARTSRGGRDQFQWGDVAADKDRENYLGHSLLAPVGRWQMNKDLTWYAKDKADIGRAGIKGASGSTSAAAAAATAQAEMLARERALIKQEEEDRRLEALGIRKRVPKPLGLPQLDAAEAAQLFAKAKSEPTDPAAASAADSSADRVSGLGFNAEMVPTGAHGGAVPDGRLQLEAGGEMEGVGLGGAIQPASASASAAAAAASSSSAAASAVPSRSLADDHADLLLLSDPSLDAGTRSLLMEAAAIRAKEARRRERKEGKASKKESKHKDRDRERDDRKKESKSRRHRSRSRSASNSRSRSRSRGRDRSRERRRHREHEGAAAPRSSDPAPPPAAAASSTTPPAAAAVPAAAADAPRPRASARSRSRSPRDRHRHHRSRHDSRSRSRSRSRDRKRER